MAATAAFTMHARGMRAAVLFIMSTVSAFVTPVGRTSSRSLTGCPPTTHLPSHPAVSRNSMLRYRAISKAGLGRAKGAAASLAVPHCYGQRSLSGGFRSDVRMSFSFESATYGISPILRPLRRWKQPDVVLDAVQIRGVQRQDTLALAELCTDCFFGEHRFSDGPIIFAQRLFYFVGVLQSIARRIGFEEGRQCKLFVAEINGEICGCVDLAIHVYEYRERKLELSKDTMPALGSYAWRPYIASLAVRREFRRQGIARSLLKEAEQTARDWGHHEILLEVAHVNLGALAFYKQSGYRILSFDALGAGTTQVDSRGFYWEVYPVGKYLLGKQIWLW
uniref:N-acetyltransferase domain-containing protein n=1 Tax=Chrysotila carterae TaxID=13221 RepID=A0A7S4EX32_CHRCT